MTPIFFMAADWDPYWESTDGKFENSGLEGSFYESAMTTLLFKK
jgi:hypothetical protein